MRRYLQIDSIAARPLDHERDRYGVTILLECDGDSLARLRLLLEATVVETPSPTTVRALPSGPIEAEFIDEDGGPR